MNRISCHVPKEIAEHATRAAKQAGVSVSAYLRDLIGRDIQIQQTRCSHPATAIAQTAMEKSHDRS